MQVKNNSQRGFSKIVEAVAFSVAPVVFCVLILLYFGFDLLSFAPFYSDELHYWNEISSLNAAGFNAGYSVINEQPAKLEFLQFGPHGPGFPAVGYLYSSIFGWRLYSPVVMNSVFFHSHYSLFTCSYQPVGHNVFLFLVSYVVSFPY